MFVTQDSGERVDFDTGSRRDTQEGKDRYDLIGLHGLKRLAGLMARGADKYGEHNWTLGQPVSRSFASMFRHMLQWRNGEQRDEDHLAAVAFNVFSIIHVEECVKRGELPEYLLDLPIYAQDAKYSDFLTRAKKIAGDKLVYDVAGVDKPTLYAACGVAVRDYAEFLEFLGMAVRQGHLYVWGEDTYSVVVEQDFGGR